MIHSGIFEEMKQTGNFVTSNDTPERSLEKALDRIAFFAEHQDTIDHSEVDKTKLDTVVANLDMLMARVNDVLSKIQQDDNEYLSTFREVGND